MSKKHQDPEWLRKEYVKKERSTYEIANDVPVTQENVRYWLDKHDIERRDKSIELPDAPDIDDDKIRQLYHDEHLNTRQIAAKLGCSREYVRVRLHEMGAEPTDKFTHKLLKPAYYTTTKQGYEYWQVGIEGESHAVPVHRLIAVAEFGFDSLCGKVVHHKNHIPWDNRPENLDLMTRSEHSRHHSQVFHGNKERDTNV